jgi:hypothetical protein
VACTSRVEIASSSPTTSISSLFHRHLNLIVAASQGYLNHVI